jgi:hypothetical protein
MMQPLFSNVASRNFVTLFAHSPLEQISSQVQLMSICAKRASTSKEIVRDLRKHVVDNLALVG